MSRQLSRSYPYLDISRKWGLPYSQVLADSDLVELPGAVLPRPLAYAADLVDARLLMLYVVDHGMGNVDSWVPTVGSWEAVAP